MPDETVATESNETRLLLGAGTTRLPGWVPIDRKLGQEVYPLPEEYGTDSVDEMRASHILEHFPFGNVDGEPTIREVLAHWVDRLKPGARIRISVPDAEKILAMRDDPRRLHYLMGGQVDDDDVHRSAFDDELLRELMSECGLVDICSWQSDNTDTASHAVSLNLQGVKAAQATQKTRTEVKVAALMTIPRLGFNTHWGCAIDALLAHHIPLRRGTGAFWGNCLENLLDGALDDNLDWILTIDYDSIFTKDQLGRLMQTMAQYPEIDALCATQARREGDTPLCTVQGESEVDVGGYEPIKVTTAHFGLTLIRVDALRKIPKPWFLGIPNASGGYDDARRDENISDRLRELRRWAFIPDENHGRIDADIWFWHMWRLQGNSVYMSPRISIGHLEEKVLYFDDEFNAQSVYMSEWRELHGMPTERKKQ